MNQCACDIVLVDDAVVGNHGNIVLGDIVVEKHSCSILLGHIIIENITVVLL
jgi:hypothetical protein